MIAVIGGAGLKVQVMMIPKEDAYEQQPQMGDMYDYNQVNVAAQIAQGDDIKIESNGSAFNMACYLAKLGKDVTFLSVAADDAMGLAVIEQLKRAGVGYSHVDIVEGNTPVQVELLNVLNDPQMVFGNSKLYEAITPERVQGWSEVLDGAEAIVLDGAIPKETLEYIAEAYGGKEGVKLFFDPAGYVGAVNSRDVIGNFYCVMPGRVEAEAMVRNTVLSADQLMEAGQFFEDKGVKRIIITIKGGGLYYKEGSSAGVLAPERVLSFAMTSGAGDVVSAAVVAADLDGKPIEEVGAFAMQRAAEFLAGKSDERMIDVLNEKN